MPNPLYILQIAVFFGLTIAVHEFGHFLAAKLSGVRVDKFALGFGPPMLKFTRGETEYSLRVIPLGGFVSMPGETSASEGADDPRALVKQPIRRRALIFSSGVVMNIILAVVLFAIAFPLGVEQTAPFVGLVDAGSPAEVGGLKPGDRIIEVNGRRIESFEDFAYEVAASNPGTPFDILIERRSDDGAAEHLELTGIRSRKMQMAPAIGIGAQIETLIKDVVEGSEAWQIGLRADDRFIAIDGRKVEYWQALSGMLAAKGDSPLEFTIVRDGREMVLEADPTKIHQYQLGFEPPLVVLAFLTDSPAKKAGLMKEDIICAVGDRPWPSATDLQELVVADKGEGIDVGILREGRKLTFHIVPAELPAMPGRRMIGIRHHPEYVGGRAMVGPVEDDGPAAKAGLKSGDVIEQ
ncbi:MAG: RIP metalloprotease RseP, partial [Phycisphaerae bacterium]|nr:RIP metalloprotease RseP [Phycisphaerae bacterium]